MEFYVGLDVSLKQTAICVVDGNGKIISEKMVVSDPDVITDFVRTKAAGAIRVGLETGPTATWLWSELKQRGLPVTCIDARHTKAALKMQINKSDRNDAFGIARRPCHVAERKGGCYGSGHEQEHLSWSPFSTGYHPGDGLDVCPLHAQPS
jgi:transposase